MGCINVKALRIGESINVNSYRIGLNLKINTSLICSINIEKILRVEPKYIFLNTGNGFKDDVFIYSNIQWNIN